MKKIVFKGSGVALITPFTENGIDFNKLEELINFHIEEGTDALVIAGTTGEASTLTDEEYKALLKFTVEKVAGKIPVIAGTGSNNTKVAIEKSKCAEALGCDAILLVTPYYNKTTQKGLYEHFKVIAENTSLPIILYNVPGRTGMNIEPQTVKKLSQISNIVGLKECNFMQAAQIIKLCGPDFAIYSGEDALVVPLLSLGGSGVISVMANIIPKDTHHLVQSFLEGDLAQSRDLQLQALDLINALFSETSPIPVKAAMNEMGMNVGSCRMPLTSISEDSLEKLKIELQNYKLVD